MKFVKRSGTSVSGHLYVNTNDLFIVFAKPVSNNFLNKNKIPFYTITENVIYQFCHNLLKNLNNLQILLLSNKKISKISYFYEVLKCHLKVKNNSY